MVDALTFHRRDERVEHEEPVCADVQLLVQRPFLVTAQQDPRERPADVMVPRADQQRTVPRREQVASAVAYSSGDPWSAMSPVTSRTSGAGDIEQTCPITCAARATDSGRPPMWRSLTWATVSTRAG